MLLTLPGPFLGLLADRAECPVTWMEAGGMVPSVCAVTISSQCCWGYFVSSCCLLQSFS
jgi:hypothetical protein